MKKRIDDYPPVLRIEHMAEIWEVSVSRAYALNASGEFDFCRIRQSSKLRFSRDRVKAWANGEVVHSSAKLRRVS